LSYAPRVCPPAWRSPSLQTEVHVNISRAGITQRKLHKPCPRVSLNTMWLLVPWSLLEYIQFLTCRNLVLMQEHISSPTFRKDILPPLSE
jgi:hypothetical protein